ncbi:hypothetical protein EIP86_004448 [Pleurotus ostreatoroseus]|nr:hypothetical protein EIP86_004448 [Pleurotus ostreatoroseus]
MSDPRFARLKSDPRFRRVRKKEAKVVVDERFKNVFDGSGKKKDKKGKGTPLSDTHEQDNLRRFYRFQDEEAANEEGEPSTKVPDYARGEVLLESSDEEDAGEDDESDAGGVVTLGAAVTKPIHVLDDNEEHEVDLDEDNFADLDAQAAEYSKAHEDEDNDEPDANRTRRLAVVNLDWDHVRATHLYKIFASLVSPTASALPSSSVSGLKPDKKGKGAAKATISRVVRGKVLSVRVYPSEFGKERMAKEEKEGPPRELFSKSNKDEDADDLTPQQTADGEDYNEEALRKYHAEAASHLYSELEGTELERSANVFDLSFVPDEMKFDDEFRDEATEDISGSYKPLDFTTDALRHSKVKLTWDEDDPERNNLTRRTLTRKEIEENDFRAYLASDTESESEGEGAKKMNREKLRALLLSGGDDTLPEGWGAGKGFDDDADDVDMEITFTPGLSATKGDEDETTLEKYQRKMKEKKKKRKEEMKERVKDQDGDKEKKDTGAKDDFFGSDDESESDGKEEEVSAKKSKKDKKAKAKAKAQTEHEDSPETERHAATAEELALLAASDNPNGELKHFDMKAVLKAEKGKGKKHKRNKSKKNDGDEANELQEDFAIDVKDERFKAVLEDHTFAIDPSNPQFKKTKSMAALLDERSKRQKDSSHKRRESKASDKKTEADKSNSLKSLVESVKRKSMAADGKGVGKRRKL